MSELEKEEIMTRIKAMDHNELETVVRLIPDDILWDELRCRDELKTSKLQSISSIMAITHIV